MAKKNIKRRKGNIYNLGGTTGPVIPSWLLQPSQKDLDTSKLSMPTASASTGGLSSQALNMLSGAAGAIGTLTGNAISGGMSSGVGDAITNTFGTIGDSVPLVGGFIKGTGSIIGGVTNALFGSKLNQENINSIENSINSLNNIQVDDSSTDSVLDQFGDTTFGQTFTKSDIGKDGLFSNKASKKYKKLKQQQREAVNRALGQFENASDNVNQNQVLDSMAMYKAYGGPMTIRYGGVMSPFGSQYYADGGSINIKPSKRGTFTAAAKKHGKSVQAFASQVLANKDNYSPAMVKKAVFAKNSSKWKHSYGGFLDDGYTDFNYNSIPYQKEISRKYAGGGNTEGDYEGDSPISRFVPKDMQKAADVAWGVGEVLPGIGSVLGVGDVANDIYNISKSKDITFNDLANLGLDIAGLVPGVKAITKAAKLAKKAKATKVAEKLDKAAEALRFTSSEGVRETKDGVQKAKAWNKRTSKELARAATEESVPFLKRGNSTINRAIESSKFTNGVLNSVDNALSPTAVKYNNLRLTARTADSVNDIFNLTGTSNEQAMGGFLDNTHGGIFDNGITVINNGGTHEENPYEGVQMGMDSEGIPNLVEEGEVVFNNYVFSNRIKIPDSMKKKYKLRGKTFADAAKYAQKESEERPNDPISNQGLWDIMAKLSDSQERAKAKIQRNNGTANRFDDGGFTYGVNMLNLDRNINTSDLYKQGSDYMNARQYVLDNWDTPYVQNWINSYYRPFVTKYNASRGYSGDFNVNRDQFEKGTYDSSFGGMHQGLLNFQYPDITSNTGSPMTVYTTRGRSGGDISINPDYVSSYGYSIPDDIVETATDQYGNTINYISNDRLRKARATNTGTDNSTTNSSTNNPVNPLTYLRYAPALGGAIGFLQGILSKPDYSNADAILEASKSAGRYMPVDYKPVGNYLKYTPFDRDYYINQLASQASATRRAAKGFSAGNRATAMANLLASDYNAQTNLGKLARQAAEYNFNNRKEVETFNRDTNKFNSEMALKAAMANQDAYAKSASARLNGTIAAMNMRNAIDTARSNAISANLSNFVNSLGDIGREEVQAEWIKDNPALYYYFSRNGGGNPYKNSSGMGGYITRKNKKRRRR